MGDFALLNPLHTSRDPQYTIFVLTALRHWYIIGKVKGVLILKDIFSKRLRTLREGMNISQAKVAKLSGTTQASINRYENRVGLPPHDKLLWYADYFDVSMDYIYGRTDKPQGELYDYQPKIIEDSEEMQRFVEMCFDPESPMHDRLKQTLIDMVKDGENK